MFWHDSRFLLTILLCLVPDGTTRLPPPPKVTCCSRFKRSYTAGFRICVTKLATVFQEVYIKKKPTALWLELRAHVLPCGNTRDLFPSNVKLLSHVGAFLRRPICPWIVKLSNKSRLCARDAVSGWSVGFGKMRSVIRDIFFLSWKVKKKKKANTPVCHLKKKLLEVSFMSFLSPLISFYGTNLECLEIITSDSFIPPIQQSTAINEKPQNVS